MAQPHVVTDPRGNRQAVVCQAKMFSQVLDPDFNYVSYQWKWKRNGTAVRTITHGGLMDVLASGIGAVGDVQP